MTKSVTFYLAISVIFFASSCGTRKVEVAKTETLQVENSYSEGSKTVLGNTFTYTPFDALKPMKIEGKVYENAIVSNDKSISKETYKHFNIYHHYNIASNKETTRTDNTWLYLGLFFIFVLFAFLWFYLPKLKTGI